MELPWISSDDALAPNSHDVLAGKREANRTPSTFLIEFSPALGIRLPLSNWLPKYCFPSGPMTPGQVIDKRGDLAPGKPGGSV